MRQTFKKGDRVWWKSGRRGFAKHSPVTVGTVVGFCKTGGVLVRRDGVKSPHPRLPSELRLIVEEPTK